MKSEKQEIKYKDLGEQESNENRKTKKLKLRLGTFSCCDWCQILFSKFRVNTLFQTVPEMHAYTHHHTQIEVKKKPQTSGLDLYTFILPRGQLYVQ